MKWNPGLVAAIVTGLLASPAITVAAQEAERTALVEVTGTGFAGPCSGPSRTEVVDGITYESELSCQLRWDMSDPRLDGTVTWASSSGQDGSVGFGYTAISIENDGGTWRQRPVVAFDFPGAASANVEYFVLDGDGDHEGLIALLTLVDDTESEADWRMQGFIIEGAFPPPPDNASAK
jgi:hypothetical protein